MARKNIFDSVMRNEPAAEQPSQPVDAMGTPEIPANGKSIFFFQGHQKKQVCYLFQYSCHGKSFLLFEMAANL